MVLHRAHIMESSQDRTTRHVLKLQMELGLIRINLVFRDSIPALLPGLRHTIRFSRSTGRKGRRCGGLK